MKYFIQLILGLMMAGPFFSRADRRSGLERMERFDLLPCLMEGTMARQYSSRDRSGGNDDGFNSSFSELYIDENGEAVLFDERVPGCVYRIWMTMHSEDAKRIKVRFYFDGESVPRFESFLIELFQIEPFLNPLAGDYWYSSGGFYNYYPFSYSESLKITLSESFSDSIHKILYYNITYHRFDDSEGVVTWTGDEDITAVMAAVSASGEDPKSTNNNSRIFGAESVSGGEEVSIFTSNTPGVIQSIKFETASLSPEERENIELVMNWDGGEPEVEVPFCNFFSYTQGGIDTESLPLGMSSVGHSCCFFPMPFWNSAEISLRNKNGTSISNMVYEIQVATNSFSKAETGYFCAQFNESSVRSDGRDYVFLDVKGRGHLVGMSLYVDSDNSSLSYLEGDERIYVDGSLTPAIYGTGAEDYFNCGWYYAFDEVSLPYHGCTYKMNGNTHQYRMHITDAVPFNQSIRAGLEHGEGNGSSATYESVSYYYLSGEKSSGMALIADLDHGDAWSEPLYGYTLSSGDNVSSSWAYEGDEDNIVLDDHGYAYTGAVSSFSVSIPENQGLLLRRRTDQSIGGQTASVFVDGDFAGIWNDPDGTMGAVDKRWLDSEFMISSNLVAGKTEVDISIVPEDTAPAWNEYRMWVYAVKPFSVWNDVDEDQLPDDWELEYATSLAVLEGSVDSDSDGLTDLEEYIADTHPTNSASYLQLGADLSFDSAFGRRYILEECTNLIQNAWNPVMEGIPGNGSAIQLPDQQTQSISHGVFHRLKVEMP